jgi:hypothetical protein
MLEGTIPILVKTPPEGTRGAKKRIKICLNQALEVSEWPSTDDVSRPLCLLWLDCVVSMMCGLMLMPPPPCVVVQRSSLVDELSMRSAPLLSECPDEATISSWGTASVSPKRQNKTQTAPSLKQIKRDFSWPNIRARRKNGWSAEEREVRDTDVIKDRAFRDAFDSCDKDGTGRIVYK